MKNKTQRLLEIKKIITAENISSQEELLKKLEASGLSYTQATLSRDLKFLKVSRVVDAQMGYVYRLPNQEKEREIGNISTQENFAVLGFQSIQFSNNLGVIKTLPGYAQGIASLIDSLELFEILGTIAGDDTILVIPNENISKQDVINSLTLSLPSMKEKLK